MTPATAAARAQLIDLGRSLHERRLTPGRTGNLSVRIGDGFLITPTGASLGRLTPETLAHLGPGGQHHSGAWASKEWPLHAALYERDPHTAAVAHVHSTHAVAVSLLPDLDITDALPRLTPYYATRVRRLPVVPYLPPGDPELANAIRSITPGIQCALLAAHGTVAADKDLETAVDAIEEIEEAAKLYLLTYDKSPHQLTGEQLEALRRSQH